jgi:hypothetical protein
MVLGAPVAQASSACGYSVNDPFHSGGLIYGSGGNLACASGDVATITLYRVSPLINPIVAKGSVIGTNAVYSAQGAYSAYGAGQYYTQVSNPVGTHKSNTVKL